MTGSAIRGRFHEDPICASDGNLAAGTAAGGGDGLPGLCRAEAARVAEQFVTVNEAASLMLKSTADWAVERGLTNGAMRAAAVADDAAIARHARQARECRPGDEQALERLAAIPEMELGQQSIADAKESFAALQALRSQVDAELKKPGAERNPELVAAVVPSGNQADRPHQPDAPHLGNPDALAGRSARAGRESPASRRRDGGVCRARTGTAGRRHRLEAAAAGFGHAPGRRRARPHRSQLERDLRAAPQARSARFAGRRHRGGREGLFRNLRQAPQGRPGGRRDGRVSGGVRRSISSA